MRWFKNFKFLKIYKLWELPYWPHGVARQGCVFHNAFAADFFFLTCKLGLVIFAFLPREVKKYQLGYDYVLKSNIIIFFPIQILLIWVLLVFKTEASLGWYFETYQCRKERVTVHSFEPEFSEKKYQSMVLRLKNEYNTIF